MGSANDRPTSPYRHDGHPADRLLRRIGGAIRLTRKRGGHASVFASSAEANHDTDRWADTGGTIAHPTADCASNPAADQHVWHTGESLGLQLLRRQLHYYPAS